MIGENMPVFIGEMCGCVGRPPYVFALRRSVARNERFSLRIARCSGADGECEINKATVGNIFSELCISLSRT